jgi:hypothetical protein
VSSRRPGSRHDQLFKDLFRSFFPDFVRLVAPGPAERLDLANATFLDKEAFTDWPRGRRRELDLLASVPLLSDSGRRALIHVEIEARANPRLGLRQAGYYMQLRLRHGLPVLPIAVCLKRGRPGPELVPVVDDQLGPELGCFRYYSFGLAGCKAEDYLGRPEPLAWALASLMRPERLSRAALKLACLRRIFSAPGTDLERFLLANCVETYVQLLPEEETELAMLQSQEPDRQEAAMFLTWAEKMELKGMRQVVCRLLAQRFGPLSEEVSRKLEAISSFRKLERLADKILVAKSLDEMGLG